MCRLKLALTTTLLLGAGIALAGPSSAAVGVPDGIRPALDQIGVIDNAQYVWGGRRYCWYDDGWRGPGWYQCGYRLRRGFGWGGPMGWQGWRGGYGGEFRRGEGREFRRDEFRRGEGRDFRRGEGREFRRGEGREFRRGSGPDGGGGGGPFGPRQ
jgi:hypothetical protein